MGKELEIDAKYADGTLNLALDTLKNGKQAIVFVNTRRGAEAQAERIAAKVESKELKKISDQVLNVLSSPTRQCKRLAKCVLKGSAFHHSGLHPKQRDLIEENFREGKIKVICATPTLAMGVDLPAFRVVLRDLKRYGGPRGMHWIPVLEYEQMSGRAGRPSFDSHGEAICIASGDSDKDVIWEKYVEGEPEEITSKLAVEPVLRIYVLSLVATEFCRSKEELYGFFNETFYAHHYADSYELQAIIDKMVDLLIEWEFLKGEKQSSDFVSASDLGKQDGSLEATAMGKRVSELYLDPYTANYINECLRKAASGRYSAFSWLHMVSSCLEMRPLLRVKNSEYEMVRSEALPYLDVLFDAEPSESDYEYEQFQNSLKTALFFKAWTEEKEEDFLLEKFGIRPGEIRVKLDLADWLFYSAQELASLLSFKPLGRELAKARERVKYGVHEELLPLLKLRNIGRVRARKLYRNGVKDIGGLKKADVTTLVQLLGKKLAIDVKKQVGVDLDKSKVPERKRKGQINLNDFGGL